MSKTYEIALRSNFERMQLLEKMMEGRWLRIYYQERNGSGPFKSIMTPVTGSFYPVVYKVQYTMPMYVDTASHTPKLDRGWSQALVFTLSEEALLGKGSVGVSIDGGFFPPDKKPFNKHVEYGWICCGNFWDVSRAQGGLWYFVQIVGALLNLDKTWMDTSGDHLSTYASQWWRARRYQPTNKIPWAFNLMQRAASEHERRPQMTIVSQTTKPLFKIK